jgi:hypothetical protein
MHLFLAGYNCINLYRFMFTLITILVNGNFNNGVVIRPIVFKKAAHAITLLLMTQMKTIIQETKWL